MSCYLLDLAKTRLLLGNGCGSIDLGNCRKSKESCSKRRAHKNPAQTVGSVVSGRQGTLNLSNPPIQRSPLNSEEKAAARRLKHLGYDCGDWPSHQMPPRHRHFTTPSEASGRQLELASASYPEPPLISNLP